MEGAYQENEKLVDQFQGHCKEGDSEKRLSRKNWQRGVCWWSIGPGPVAGPKGSSEFVQGTLQATGQLGQPLGVELLDSWVAPLHLCSRS